VHTLGPLIHNPQVVDELRERGVEEAHTIDEVDEGILVIRSHGVAPAVIEQAQSKGLRVIDATCPHVSKAHEAARQLRERGFVVVVVGEPGHPEVEGIRAWAGEGAIVVQEPSDLPDVLALGGTGEASAEAGASTGGDMGAEGVGAGTGAGAGDGAGGTGAATIESATSAQNSRVGVVVQTTQAPGALDAIIDALKARGIAPLVRNTICFATRQRQEAATELAATVDVMLVVGGRNSGNTTRLAKLCQTVCPRTHHIESAAELDPAWFRGARAVGITAGASTPENQITAVEQALEHLGQHQLPACATDCESTDRQMVCNE
jgi:4-hydroxy-3-methylbut-2-enyl diphosphate reductase